MARSDSQQMIVYALAGYVLYRAALAGTLGQRAQQIAVSVRSGQLPSDGAHNSQTPTNPTGGGGNVPPGGISPNTPPSNCTGDIGMMQAENPNIITQMYTWQMERNANRQNQYDWEAFRAHAKGIGAPDPGPVPPAEFCRYGY